VAAIFTARLSPPIFAVATSWTVEQAAKASKVPTNFPGGIKPVTWSGNLSADTPGLTISWQWGAAVYTSFNGDPNYNLDGVKPVDDAKASIYKNADHAGTPENEKKFVIGGATGVVGRTSRAP
jgi:hypothetical protein